MTLGIRSGLIGYLSQFYLTGVKRSTVSLPIGIYARNKLIALSKLSAGIDIGYGLNIFDIEDYAEYYHNGRIGSVDIYYLINKTHLIRFGFNEHVDNVTFDEDKLRPLPTSMIFDYKIHRLSVGIQIRFNSKNF